MPIQYSSIIDEHNAVRNACGVFDVSHMGEVRVSVGDALYGTSKLVNSSAIELSRNAYLARRVAEILSKGWVIALLSILAFFTILYIILITRYRRLRKKHLRERRRAEKAQEEKRP